MPAPRLTPVVEALPSLIPFVGPETHERRTGRRFRARIGANESAFGPSPQAIAAMCEAAEEVWKYGDPENYELRTALARHHGVALENVAVGEGIDGLLGLVVRMYLEPGTPVATSDGAYPTFNYQVAGHGGRLVKVPYSGDREDLVALLDAARREAAPLLYVANPDNPMASWWNADEIGHLIASLPPRTLLLLDEAYCDLAPADAVPPLDVTNPQVLRFRTFSKAYGLAGLRVGYVLGEARGVAAFDKIRNHFGVGRIAQAGALAALQDQTYLAETVKRILHARERIVAIAREAGLDPLPSATNFVAIDGGRDGAFAQAVHDELIARDIFVRKPAIAPLDRCIRVSCGTDAGLDLLAAALGEALHAAAARLGS